MDSELLPISLPLDGNGEQMIAAIRKRLIHDFDRAVDAALTTKTKRIQKELDALGPQSMKHFNLWNAVDDQRIALESLLVKDVVPGASPDFAKEIRTLLQQQKETRQAMCADVGVAFTEVDIEESDDFAVSS